MSPQGNKNDSCERPDAKLSEEDIRQLNKHLAALEKKVADAQRHVAEMQQILSNSKNASREDVLAASGEARDIMVALAEELRQARLTMKGIDDATSHLDDR